MIGIAFKDLSKSEIRSSVESSHKRGEIEPIEKQNFISLGFFGIEDPPREESKESVRKAQKAGIKVIMITGDNMLTAKKIAHEVGIIREGFDKTIEGADLIR